MTLSPGSSSSSNPLISATIAPVRSIDKPSLLAAIIVFLFVLAMSFPLPFHSPLAGTEGHRALTAHQMVQSGEWLVPRLFGRIYLRKPPLHYWLLAAMESVAGSGAEFVWRLPSAICGASLAAVLSLFAGRWFGRPAGILAGFSYAALVPLWAQARSADIDITDVLVSNLAVMCFLEIHFGSGRRTAAWIAASSAGFAAAFMAKGPGGLPILVGSMICVAFFAVRERRAVQLLRPAFWLPLVAGLLVFAAYALAVYRYLVVHHLPLDFSGVMEGAKDLHPHDWSFQRAREWLLLPLTMFAYALPVSMSLPLAFVADVRGDDPVRSKRMLVLAWTVIASWTVCFVSGMHLPRYAYVTLPVLCPLAGGILARAVELPAKWQDALRWIVRVSLMMFAGASLVMGGILWRHADVRPVIVVAALASVTVAVLCVRVVAKSPARWRAMWPAPAVLLSLATLAACGAHYDRLRRSGQEMGQMIRSITGPDAELNGCAMVLDQPELFYYSGLPTHAFDGRELDWRDVRRSGWVVLRASELTTWQAEVPRRLSRIVPMVVNKNSCALLWYDADAPINTTPGTQP